MKAARVSAPAKVETNQRRTPVFRESNTVDGIVGDGMVPE